MSRLVATCDTCGTTVPGDRERCLRHAGEDFGAETGGGGNMKGAPKEAAACRPSPHRIERGDGWEMHHGDAVEVLATLDAVDHVITDPPYEAESHTKMRRSCRGGANADGSRNFRPAPLSFARMDENTRRLCAYHFARLARRWVAIFAQLEGVPLWRARGEGAGLRHARTCIWVKPDACPQFTGDRPGTGYETIEVMHKGKGAGRWRWNGGGRRGVFTFNAKTQQRDVGVDHETPKPLDLMMELVELFTDPGDLVVDPFAGSGSTGAACLRLGRRFIGVEREERWFNHCAARFRAEESHTTIRDARAGQRPLFAHYPP